jgi:hypothetical protein
MKEQNIVAKKEDYEGKENIILEDLENCEVHIPFIVKCIYVKHLKNCELKLTAVSGASFIDYALGCDIFLATHQLRIHHSKDTNFYIIAGFEIKPNHRTLLHSWLWQPSNNRYGQRS